MDAPGLGDGSNDTAQFEARMRRARTHSAWTHQASPIQQWHIAIGGTDEADTNSHRMDAPGLADGSSGTAQFEARMRRARIHIA